MKDFVGINGHTFQFKPELYGNVAGQARDYHPLTWDLHGKPNEPATFPYSRHKIQKGKRVNWEEVYTSWKDAGFQIDACITFGWHYKEGFFEDMPAEMEAYGEQFARFFGPSGKLNLVQAMEIGNEPPNDGITIEDYVPAFVAMAKGIRKGDPEMKILTCTVASDKTDQWEFPIESLNEHKDLYDVINMHSYAFVEGWPTMKRSYPEDPDTDYLKKVDRMIEWRSKNAPDKEIWVTEFGYDAPSVEMLEATRKKGMEKFIPQTELQQAQWNLRTFLALAKRPVSRAYVYYYDDKDGPPSFHANSGLTRNSVPKMAYYAQEQFYQLLKEHRFDHIVTENEDSYVYAFTKTDGSDPIWIAWHPGGTGQEREINLKCPTKPEKVLAMVTTDENPQSKSFSYDEGQLKVTIDESPCYIVF
ncbi:hypothetical protein [Rubellicoccus peritrichatus]|uniref:Glycoside hydrolase family 5 domain-containing protein n=1 Tax=Rubellicoccus peritrichatus TaxID=3080537 RepID=A0AAQ3L8D3_9BACT|nr:hypothetical protein [Puniceicoccus sp. CR14]WOO39804.1 hypothetical protein RZN69_14360 [Puniceicoccus sp. CR14]